jgi:hypothetical protein
MNTRTKIKKLQLEPFSHSLRLENASLGNTSLKKVCCEKFVENFSEKDNILSSGLGFFLKKATNLYKNLVHSNFCRTDRLKNNLNAHYTFQTSFQTFKIFIIGPAAQNKTLSFF